METTATTTAKQQERLPAVIRALNVVETVGNKLPHPFWLFWILAAILAVLSLVLSLAGVGVNDPSSGEWTPVNNLLSGDRIAMAVSTSLDASAAAHIIDPDCIVIPIGNWYFNIASSILLAIVITIVTELVLTKRQNLDADEDAEYEDLVISDKERSALKFASFAVLAMLIIVVVLVVPDGAPLRGDGPIGESPFLTGIAFIIAMLFGVGGIVYGFREGTIEKFADDSGCCAR